MMEYVSASSLLCDIEGDESDFEQDDEVDFLEEFEQSDCVYDDEEEEEEVGVPKVFISDYLSRL